MESKDLMNKPKSWADLFTQVTVHRALQEKYKHFEDMGVLLSSLNHRLGRDGSKVELINWFRNPLEVDFYLMEYTAFGQSEMAWAWNPSGPLVIIQGQRVKTRQELIDFLDDMGYEEVRPQFHGFI
jgi:hypothetical protein